ncbi:MAG: lysozyme [Caulobacteraceae bacterium]
MEPRRQISRAAIVLIKRFEGFRGEAAQLDDGRWTIGYGHTRGARADAKVDERDAEALLAWDLIAVTDAINEWTHAPLSQNQFDALASFVFNIGLENFRRSTTLRRLNEGRMLEAAAAMELWRRADFEGERIVIDALVRRRASEKILFLKPDAPWPAAPSPVLPPKIDYDAAALLPSQTPTALRARLDGGKAMAERDHADGDAPPHFHEPADTSAAQVAAAAVSARLETLMVERTGGAAEAPRDIEPALEAALETTPAAAQSIAEPVAAQPALAADRRAEPIVRWGRPRRRRQAGPLILFALGLVGVALFFAAIRWGFEADTDVSGAGGGVAGGALGWGLGLAGIICFAIAVYGLLARLGDRGGRPGD